MSEHRSSPPPQHPYPGYPQWAPRVPGAPTGLALTARILAVLVTLVSFGSLALAFPALDTYREAAADGKDASDVFTGYEMFVAVWVLLMLVSYIVTCLWLTECRTRVDALAPHIWQRRSKVWVWLAWLVPVVNIWFPYQVMRDLRRGSHPHQFVTNKLVGWWLAAWLGYTWLDQAATNLLPFSGEIDIELLETAFIPTQVISTLLAVVACALWLRIISDIMRGQAELGRPPAQPGQWPSQPVHWPTT